MDIQVKRAKLLYIAEPEFRGAQVNQEEKDRLNKLGGKILREVGLDFEEWKDYNWILNETKDNGYADFYLTRCWNDPIKINEADATVYQRLVDIDTVLGTSLSLQLASCIFWTTRWDIIKVKHLIESKIHKYFRISTLNR